MDLNALLTLDPNAATSRAVLSKHPDGTDDAVFIVVGPDADGPRAEGARQRREGVKRRNNPDAQMDLTTDAGAAEMDDAVQSNMLGTACAAVVGWEGITENGQPKPFDPAAVRMILGRRSDWREIVLAKHGNRTDFLPK